MEIMEIERDPMLKMIENRLKNIKKIIIFASGKGGVGKSTISAHSSYIFSKKYKTGILDLDLHGPSIPFILGINNIKIIESENGIFPVEWNNIKVMSLDIFMQGRAAPLRGSSKNEIIKEMVGITDFGNLDYLIIDMPPGTGDEYLSTIEIFREKGEIIFITAPSKISWQVTKRAIDIAKNQISIKGIIINMGHNEEIQEECKKISVKCLGSIEYFSYVVDKGIGDLEGTEYFKNLENILKTSGIIH